MWTISGERKLVLAMKAYAEVGSWALKGDGINPYVRRSSFIAALTENKFHNINRIYTRST
jgi:hypothetical protein